jgi:hypothetical protein
MHGAGDFERAGAASPARFAFRWTYLAARAEPTSERNHEERNDRQHGGNPRLTLERAPVGRAHELAGPTRRLTLCALVTVAGTPAGTVPLAFFFARGIRAAFFFTMS